MFRVPSDPDNPSLDDTFKVGFGQWLKSSAAERKEWTRRKTAALRTKSAEDRARLQAKAEDMRADNAARSEAAKAKQEQLRVERDEIRAELSQAKADYAAQRMEAKAASAERKTEALSKVSPERQAWLNSRTLAKFDAITLKPSVIRRGMTDLQPLAGVTATVETGEALSRRTTAARVIAGAAIGAGVGAVIGAVAKKTTGGTHYLVIAGPTFEWQVELPGKDLNKARQFAAQVNTAAKQLGRTP